MSPERLWLLAIRLHRRRHHRIAKKIKQLNSFLYHNELANGAEVSPDVYLGHNGLGTVIHDHVTIGRHVKIWHNVTLAVRSPYTPDHRIIIEDDVTIGAGAIVITPRNRSLTIGTGSFIGAGAVVTHDVPPGSVAVGVPAQARPRTVKQS